MIHILSFHGADNYGAVLQNYALQQYLILNGYKVDTLNYKCDVIESSYIPRIVVKRNDTCKRSVFYRIARQIKDLLMYGRIVLRHKNFNKFREDFLVLSSLYKKEYLLSGNFDSKEDVYITGSDQIWNTEILKDTENPIYTLSFVGNKKTVAYAASAGNEKFITQNELDSIKKIECISVRENSLQKYLCEKLNREIACVVDPVFLIKKHQWEEILNKGNNRKKGLIFLYYIGSNAPETIQIAIEHAKYTKRSIVYSGMLNTRLLGRAKCIYQDGPIEFLYNIKDANIVIASSFHAVAFSIIFEKDFIVVPHEKTGGRVIDLLKVLGLEKQIVYSVEEYIERQEELLNIDYSPIKDKINQMVKESKHFLDNTLKTMY